MRFARAVASLAGVLACSASLLAQSPSSPQPNAFGNLFGQRPRPRKQPQSIFAGASTPSPAPGLAQAVIVCGLTLLPADPAVDAAIRHPLPANVGTFTMQKIVPSACQR